MTEDASTARPRQRQPAKRSANTAHSNSPGPAAPNTTPPVTAVALKTNWTLICELLHEKKKQIGTVIPAGVNLTVESLIQSAIQFMHTSREAPTLKRCKPSTVLYAVIGAAAIGLDLTGDQCYLIGYERTIENNGARVHDFWECRLMVGYKGMITVAARNGFHMDIQAVFEGEAIQILLGTANTVEHVAGFDTTKPIVGVYGVIRDKETDRVLHIERMSKIEIDGIAQESTSKVWKNARRYGEMARKTVARRCFKWLPKSGAKDMAVLQEIERRYEADLPLTDLAADLVGKGKMAEGKAAPVTS